MKKLFSAIKIVSALTALSACLSCYAVYDAIEKNDTDKMKIYIQSDGDIDLYEDRCSIGIFRTDFIPSGYPSNGSVFSSFGWRKSPFGSGRDFHTGIDFKGPQGSEIFATADGEVLSAGWNGGYGRAVRIKHMYGFETLYGHCSEIRVSQGDKIKAGSVIALSGMTGNALEPHCHYEIRRFDIPVNPERYLKFVKTGTYKCSPAHYAAMLGRVDLVRMLYNKNPDAVLNKKDAWGFLPVDLAREAGSTDVVLFIEKMSTGRK